MPDRPPPILFDLDGTLADTIGDIAATTNHVRRSYGLPPLPVEVVRGLVGHGAGTLMRRALADAALGDDPAVWDEVRRRYTTHHDVQCTATSRLYPGVAEGLRRLADSGHALGIVTNKPLRFAERLVDHFGLADLLPVVLGGDSLPVRKPDPEPLREALRRLAAQPPAAPRPQADGSAARVRAVMVGDGETDLRAGRAAGLRTVACLYGYRPEAMLRSERPDATIAAFAELPAALGDH